MIIGSHVSFGKNGLLGSVNEALEYGANTFMFYTGAPQNTLRKPIDMKNTQKAWEVMQENNIDIENIICHAPYIVNLANNLDEKKYDFSIHFLIEEIKRGEMMNISYMVLHPGASVGIKKEEALDNIVYALNEILKQDKTVTILLETMAGKGTELGSTIEEIKYIIKHIEKKELIGVCLDTCHLNDAGYDMTNFDNYLCLFYREIFVSYIHFIHINNIKNDFSSHKDRHANIGYGTLGFDTILKIVTNPQLATIPKILETPYIGNTDTDKERIYPPYKFEIAMLKNKEFNPDMMKNIRSYYQKSAK